MYFKLLGISYVFSNILSVSFQLGKKKTSSSSNVNLLGYLSANNLGSLIQGYQEVARRLGILHEQTNIAPLKFTKPTAVKIKKK